MSDDNNTIKINQSGGGDPIEVYTSEICFYLDEYRQQGKIDDLRSISQSRWNSALYYIYQRAFKGTDKLKAEPYIDYTDETGKRCNFHSSNANAYNIDQVSAALEVYENLCFEYEKEISVFGFSRLTGIDRQTIYGWANSETPTSRGMDILKKINDSREESLSDKLFSGKGNPVGTLGILNRHFGWNMGQPHGENKANTQSIEQIQQKYLSSDVEQEQADTQTMPGGDQETDTGRLSFDD